MALRGRGAQAAILAPPVERPPGAAGAAAGGMLGQPGPALTGGTEQRERGAQRAAAGGRGGGVAPPGGDAEPEQRGHRGTGRQPATARRGETRRDRPVSRSVVRALCGHGPAT